MTSVETPAASAVPRGRAHDVRQRVTHLVQHQSDPDRPGSPLYLLALGAALAVGCLLPGLWVLYEGWLAGAIPKETATTELGLLFVGYAVGVAIFSYGYEAQDAGRAARLTLVVLVISVLAFVIVGVVFLLLKDGGSGSSSSDSDGDESSGPGEFFGRALFTAQSYVDEGSIASLSDTRRRGTHAESPPPVDLSAAAVEQPPVAEHAAAAIEEPPAATLVSCPCGARFRPAPPRFVCPFCGRLPPDGWAHGQGP